VKNLDSAHWSGSANLTERNRLILPIDLWDTQSGMTSYGKARLIGYAVGIIVIALIAIWMWR
jgi:hypothetical protein